MGSLEDLVQIEETIKEKAPEGMFNWRHLLIGVSNTIYSIRNNRVSQDDKLALIVKGYQERLDKLLK